MVAAGGKNRSSSQVKCTEFVKCYHIHKDKIQDKIHLTFLLVITLWKVAGKFSVIVLPPRNKIEDTQKL